VLAVVLGCLGGRLTGVVVDGRGVSTYVLCIKGGRELGVAAHIRKQDAECAGKR
jgi:hypothetical protein